VNPYQESKSQCSAAFAKTEGIGDGFDDPGLDCAAVSLPHGAQDSRCPVTQEALTNVARHAQASRVQVNIQKLAGCICMKIKDDGKSFQVQRVLLARGCKCLGLLCMRERLEMFGGKFVVESSPGKARPFLLRFPSARPREGETADGAGWQQTLNVYETNHCSAGRRPHGRA
jgi:anti-sigma regulatory factor (Ser/Thr protein kinase)